MLRIWDGEGTGNTVPHGPKRKNFQFSMDKHIRCHFIRVKTSVAVSIFHFSGDYEGHQANCLMMLRPEAT